MSKTYKAVVENGAIHIETPDFADGTSVEVFVASETSGEESSFSGFLQEMEKIAESGKLDSLPFDSTTLKAYRRSAL